MSSLDMSPASKKEVDSFTKKLTREAELLVSTFFPQMIADMDNLLQASLVLEDLSALRAPLDIPMPDPAKEELKRKKKEAKKEKEGKKSDDKEEDEGPPCGPIASNEKVDNLIKEIKPHIQTLKEKLNTVSMWVQLQIPRIEDGNNFGVAVQEKVFELLTNTRTKIEGFQTQITKYYSERGDAVAKASKQPHVGDYRQLVHELDQHQYCELRMVVLEIRNTYAVLFDVISKNYDKIKKPRGDCKALIY
ncbi:proteasome activator complex subunit 1 isoform X2 [Silurus meridionalis]|uniref:proteasome activator complex subunit 1 isoform X2 n=1 Tax=Silurus meridionalis TaxID=175797 RepID=UPI001EEC29AC|nr:proteasome activator complex subunit 1 isoform X2 [Silurus meridionalis]